MINFNNTLQTSSSDEDSTDDDDEQAGNRPLATASLATDSNRQTDENQTGRPERTPERELETAQETSPETATERAPEKPPEVAEPSESEEEEDASHQTISPGKSLGSGSFHRTVRMCSQVPNACSISFLQTNLNIVALL